ncbi:MAG: hypothetical protein SVZ03_12120 [Spirochaetota bacterium]|nr:hypothetical protein [Spirochaetota bacterium]
MLCNKKPLLLFPFVLIIILYYLSLENDVNGSEREIINLGKLHNINGEYYNAITEMMRYQYHYPEGEFFPESQLIMGEAYYRGGNYNNAIGVLSGCYATYKDRPEGERALLNIGYMRLISGSPFYAYRSFQEYLYAYNNGRYREDVKANLCSAIALMGELRQAVRKIVEYKTSFPDGKHAEELYHLESLINRELSRPKKNVWVSLIGSIFLPGFGHFYTYKYRVGLFSFLTNAALIFLVYDGYKDENRFRMVLFSVGAFAIYQHSLFSAVNNVYVYNRRDDFYKSVRMGLNIKF